MEKYAAARWQGPLSAALVLTAFAGTAAAQTLPAPWTARDIGAPSLSGSATLAAGVFTIDAAGRDIAGTTDEFHFVYQPIAGDVDISARIDNITRVHAWSKAGVMIRSSLDADAAHAFALVSADKGVHFRRRRVDGGKSPMAAGSSGGAPAWVRVVRIGTKVTAYWSTTGTSWTPIRSDTVALGAIAYVGIAVSSRDTGARTTARVSNVTIRTEGLPAGQQNADIGAPAIPGATSWSGGRYTIQAAGTDIWGSSDQFHFVYQPMTGNGEIAARVASLTHTHDWARAGVMIRESLTPASRHAMVVLSAGKGYSFQRRYEPAGSSVRKSDGSGTAPGWVRLVRTGDLFEAYRSEDGKSWTKFGSDTVAMGTTVYVGLAVTSRNAGAATTAVVDNLAISGAAPGDQPPAVSITEPPTGAKYTAPATVTVSATASDPEGRMASVDFFAGSALIARDSKAPYSVSWSVSSTGTYALTAVAHDADGGSTTSSAVSVTVEAALAPPRLVIFTASADHGTITSYLLEVFADGADPAAAAPIATSDLGKPAPDATNDITVDREAFFIALAPGNYLGTVKAIGPSGSTRSDGIGFSR